MRERTGPPRRRAFWSLSMSLESRRRTQTKTCVMVHTYCPRTGEAEAGASRDTTQNMLSSMTLSQQTTRKTARKASFSPALCSLHFLFLRHDYDKLNLTRKTESEKNITKGIINKR